MHPCGLFIAVTLAWLLLASTTESAEAKPEVKWTDAKDLGVEGKGWSDTAAPYDRLPARAHGVVREPVWDLSRSSAGLCVRFNTDARTIWARWSLLGAGLAMTHMPATGMSGLDLYARCPEATDPHLRWRWAGNGRPEHQVGNEQALVGGLPGDHRDFLLYLPLYNGVTKLEIGVEPTATLTPVRATGEGARPVVFYGTSITQGGCASRPGMAYSAILGRWLDRPTINLGFSGNGQMEPEVASLLAELDPAAYVLDPLPNCSDQMVAERTEPLVRTLRKAHPTTPVVLVENISYQFDWLVAGNRQGVAAKNEVLRQAFHRLQAAGVPNLYLVPGPSLYGDDSEATVDGCHATDLGFLRISRALEPTLRTALAK